MKMKDIKRKLKIIVNILGSTCGSSLVALGSSWVASEGVEKSTATTFYYLKSTCYMKGSRVALDFIQARKVPLLSLLCHFLTIKNALVAVGFIFKIISFQCVMSYEKTNCYQRFPFVKWSDPVAVGFTSVGLVSPFYHIKNRLFIVIRKIVGLRVMGLIIKEMKGFCDGSRLLDWFQVGKNRAEKAKSFTAHNYKKCDRQSLDSNRINELCNQDVKESVVRFGLVECLDSDRGSEAHPPIDNSRSQDSPHHLLLAIYCKDLIRGFHKGLLLGFEGLCVFGFRKVGGPGGVLI